MRNSGPEFLDREIPVRGDVQSQIVFYLFFD
jgi:hypothetical protein